MAGGAADCAYFIRLVSSLSRKIGFQYDTTMDTKAIAYILSSILKRNRGNELSVGTMIAGWDANNRSPSIYYVDSEGSCIKGDLFCVGSGAQFAYAVLDYYRLEHHDNKSSNSHVGDSSSIIAGDDNITSEYINHSGNGQRLHSKHEYMKGLTQLSVDEVISVAIKAVRHATYRDGYSGGYINAFIINATGIHHVQRIDSKTIRIGSST